MPRNYRSSCKTEKNHLDNAAADAYRIRFRHIIQTGETEMPLPPIEPGQSKKRGREKKSKERNLLERLRDFENDVSGALAETFQPLPVAPSPAGKTGPAGFCAGWPRPARESLSGQCGHLARTTPALFLLKRHPGLGGTPQPVFDRRSRPLS